MPLAVSKCSCKAEEKEWKEDLCYMCDGREMQMRIAEKKNDLAES